MTLEADMARGAGYHEPVGGLADDRKDEYLRGAQLEVAAFAAGVQAPVMLELLAQMYLADELDVWDFVARVDALR